YETIGIEPPSVLIRRILGGERGRVDVLLDGVPIGTRTFPGTPIGTQTFSEPSTGTGTLPGPSTGTETFPGGAVEGDWFGPTCLPRRQPLQCWRRASCVILTGCWTRDRRATLASATSGTTRGRRRCDCCSLTARRCTTMTSCAERWPQSPGASRLLPKLPATTDIVHNQVCGAADCRKPRCRRGPCGPLRSQPPATPAGMPSFSHIKLRMRS